jgi:diguanylate cyclase (GGDEF)-like protein
MAANDPNPRPDLLASGRIYLSAAALQRHLDEEVNRAMRHGTQLSCLLVVIDNLQELTREHGGELLEQALGYIGDALARGLRNFDRIGRPDSSELLVVLPGADGLRGEVVARRVLKRLETIKLETDGTRRPLRVSVGLASWQDDFSGEDLLARSRVAATTNGANSDGDLEQAVRPGVGEATPLAAGSPPLSEPPQSA